MRTNRKLAALNGIYIITYEEEGKGWAASFQTKDQRHEKLISPASLLIFVQLQQQSGTLIENDAYGRRERALHKTSSINTFSKMTRWEEVPIVELWTLVRALTAVNLVGQQGKRS